MFNLWHWRTPGPACFPAIISYSLDPVVLRCEVQRGVVTPSWFADPGAQLPKLLHHSRIPLYYRKHERSQHSLFVGLAQVIRGQLAEKQVVRWPESQSMSLVPFER